MPESTLRVALRPQPGAPRRLDVALVDALAALGVPCSRSQLARAFKAGGVTIDGAVAKARRPVDDAVDVVVSLPAPEPLRAEPDDIPLVILHEDDALLVIDKPAPLVMHPGPGHPRGTLVGAVLHHLRVTAEALPILAGNDATRPGLVHRLDRDTSGVVVVAKTMAAQTHLADQFARHDIERSYWALVDGAPAWDERRLQTGHARDPADRRRYSPEHGGRKAVTNFTLVQRFGRVAAELEATLQTGRTHQIRMHCRHLGHPVLGDTQYGHAPGDATVRSIAEALPRHALHARVLGFVHPSDGVAVRFESQLPEVLQRARAELSAGR